MLFSILAILSNATSYRKIHRFIEARLSSPNALCRVHWKRAPAHTAIRYALQGLDPAAVEVAFRGHAAGLDGPRDGLAGIALDGKTVRGSFDRFQDQKALPVLSALTAPGCPVAGSMPEWVENAVRHLAGVESVNVELVWESPWTPERMSMRAKLELNML